MIPEPYWTIGKHIFWGTVTWMALSIPVYWLLRGWQRYLTELPSETARRIWAFGPAGFTAYGHLRAGIAAAYNDLGAHSVRVILERKHKQLRRALDSIRQVLDRRLQQIVAASTGTDGSSLIDLLRGFRTDVDRALEFGTLEDGFVDDTVQRRKAQFFTILSLFAAMILAASNFGLLYLFFSEAFEGQRVPYFGIDLAVALALLFPVIEFCSGIAARFMEELSSAARYLGWLIIVLALTGFASLEYMIFYQLFVGLFEQIEGFTPGGSMHSLTSVVGPALTVLGAIFGYTLMKYWSQWRELGVHQSIRDQIGDAGRFVDGLESRYGAIERASSAACNSLDEFANQLSGRGQAELPIASTIAEQREALRAAIDDVNPELWPAFAPGADSEQRALKAQAWMLAILSLATLGIFTASAAPTLARSEVFGLDSFIASLLIAVGTGISCFVAGAHLFDRTTIAYEAQAEWRDAIFPRDVTYRAAAATAFLVAILGTAWICFEVSGLSGMSRALMLIALLLGIAVCGSYNDLVGQGLGFLWRSIAAIGGFVAATLKYGIWGLVVLIFTLAAAFVHAVIALVAWPSSWLVSLLRRRNGDSTDRPAIATS